MANYLALNPRDRDEQGLQRGEGLPRGDGLDRVGAGRQQPFALVVDSFDAHEPWDAPRRLIDMYGPARVGGGLEPIQPFETPAARTRDINDGRRLLRRMRQLYAAEVTLVDVWLGASSTGWRTSVWPRTRWSCW